MRELPIAHISAGTGNGLSASINAVSPQFSVLCAVKQWKKQIDMLSVYKGTKSGSLSHVGYCHLSFTWGFIADLDLESEVLRFCGPAREDLYALLRLISPRWYGAKLAFVLDENMARKTAGPVPSTTGPSTEFAHTPRSKIFQNDSGWQTLPPSRYFYFAVQNLAHLSTDYNGCPLARMSDGLMDVIYFAHGVSPVSFLPYLLDQTKGKQVCHPEARTIQCRAMYLEPVHPSDPEFDSHFQETSYTAPSKAGELKSGVSQQSLLPSISLTHSDPLWSKCRKEGCMAVDGERMDYGPVCIEIQPRLCTVYTPIDLDEPLFSKHVKSATDTKQHQR
jgi:diacylglycerol kinase family enzyme